MNGEPIRGVVDRFEGDYAIVVLDDGQQLDWPRSSLPADARPGMAVALSLSFAAGHPSVPPIEEGGDSVSAQVMGGWQGKLTTGESGWMIQLADGQSLRWPITIATAAQPGSQVNLQLAVDAEDTEARRKRVADLLDDIFGPPQ